MMRMMIMTMMTTIYELSERLQILTYNYIGKYYNTVIVLADVMLWREKSASHFSTNYPRISHVHCPSR